MINGVVTMKNTQKNQFRVYQLLKEKYKFQKDDSEIAQMASDFFLNPDKYPEIKDKFSKGLLNNQDKFPVRRKGKLFFVTKEDYKQMKGVL